jgi:1,4-alpha-glucan branching enzyme
MTAKKKTVRRRITFTCSAETGSQVFVSGSFNDWDAEAKQLKDTKTKGLFTGVLLLAPGRYEYKLLVNDLWSVDPNCPDWVSNDLGSLNSVLIVE